MHLLVSCDLAEWEESGGGEYPLQGGRRREQRPVTLTHTCKHTLACSGYGGEEGRSQNEKQTEEIFDKLKAETENTGKSIPNISKSFGKSEDVFFPCWKSFLEYATLP